MTHTVGSYLRLDEPAEHVLVQAHHDGSALIAVFGPFPTLEAAEVAKGHLLAVGITDGAMTAMPVREVEMNERPAVGHQVVDQPVCGWVWTTADADHTHECKLPMRWMGSADAGHECPCGARFVNGEASGP